MATDAIADYHRLTIHTAGFQRPADPRLRDDIRPMDPARRPPEWKRYPGAERVELTASIGRDDWLSRLLHLSAGLVRTKQLQVPGMDPWTAYFRAAGSAGNLQPVDVHVVMPEPAGVWHYDPEGHALERVADAPSDVNPTLVLTGVPWRTGWKYLERGYRHLFWDAGSMTAQILVVAADLGLDPRVEIAFVDKQVAKAVGADRKHELPLAVIGLDGRGTVPDVEGASGEIADDPEEFPLVTEAHRAGEFADDDAVDRWRSKAADAGEEGPDPGWDLREPIDEVILRRGSTRTFTSETAPAELLAGGLAWAARTVHGDFHVTGGTLTRQYVAVHAVEGFAPGLYRLDPDGLTLLQETDVRMLAKVLCLTQDLGGDGAFTVFHSAPLEEILTELGPRGWRAAHLEAGVNSGRLHLAAFALGFGATGLTFFDEEVRKAFDTDDWPLLVTAVGKPSYRSTPGGRPRDPVRLG